MTATNLRVLLVEDSDDDYELIVHALGSGPWTLAVERVDTEPALRRALAASPWDIVLADYSLPGFDALRTLEVLTELTPETPLIVVSGTVGEDVAVETLKLGADDYLLKASLTRLVAAVGRALELASSRRQRAALEAEREQTQARLVAFNAELEQRVAERTEELQRANRELESFAYAVSHDLRTPLTGVLGSAELLLLDHDTVLSESGHRHLDRLLESTRRMNELIDDLLDLSRATRDEMRREPVDLSLLAHAVIARLRESSPHRCVEVVIDDQLVADGDPRLLRIVLENLLGNAWKYTANAPDPRIEFRSAGGVTSPAFSVRDNGAGFDAADAARIFSPFQRLHDATEFPGTGIGLATVQRIVTRHGGRIVADGRSGQGATFTFTLGTAPESPR
ncbi:MAG TPA: ATP-binding protein [Ilumatobacter sp.]|nr:ATP-binding protein [Ilumatobacter sp.]